VKSETVLVQVLVQEQWQC